MEPFKVEAQAEALKYTRAIYKRYQGLTTEAYELKPAQNEIWLLEFLEINFQTGAVAGNRYIDVYMNLANNNRFLKEWILAPSEHKFYAFCMGDNFDGYLFPNTKLQLTHEVFLHLELSVLAGDSVEINGCYETVVVK